MLTTFSVHRLKKAIMVSSNDAATVKKPFLMSETKIIFIGAI